MIVLRDQSRKGRLKPRMMVAGLLYAVALYAIGLPAGLLYLNHPGNRLDEAIQAKRQWRATYQPGPQA